MRPIVFNVARLFLIAALVLSSTPGFSGEPGVAPDDEPIKTIDEHKVYRLVNGEPILGREILDLVLEDHWETQLQAFVEHILRSGEISAANIAISDEEVDAEMQALLTAQARRIGVDPRDMKVEDVVKRVGMVGGIAVLKRNVRENIGMLRVLQKENKVPAGVSVAERVFQEAMRERMEKRVAEKGVVTDPKRLGGGEAVRIGARGFSKDEVRAFIVDMVRSMPLSELKNQLDVLTLERAVAIVMKQKGLELTQDDREFHFSYLCRLYERETGVPGRVMLRQEMQKIGKTPEQFLASRLFKYDASITCLSKGAIREKQLKEEFANHPERYKRSENLIAHLLVRVLDPEGRPYTNNWQAPGHDAVNNYVAKMREQQFTAARPKIEALTAAAKQDWDGTVRKASEDTVSARVNGMIGRVGPETVLFPPCDKNVREAAIKLKPGEMSGPVRSDFGWHLLKCLEKQDVTFDEAAESVYLSLIKEARQKTDAETRAAIKIEDKLD